MRKDDNGKSERMAIEKVSKRKLVNGKKESEMTIEKMRR
jgi:hypothetical protein